MGGFLRISNSSRQNIPNWAMPTCFVVMVAVMSWQRWGPQCFPNKKMVRAVWVATKVGVWRVGSAGSAGTKQLRYPSQALSRTAWVFKGSWWVGGEASPKWKSFCGMAIESGSPPASDWDVITRLTFLGTYQGGIFEHDFRFLPGWDMLVLWEGIIKLHSGIN